jgi:tetratricopeptide (TPR) repeat protein
MTESATLLSRLHGGCVPLLVLLLVFGAAGPAPAQATPSHATTDPDLFGPELKPLILAEQYAVSSGEPDAILEYSRDLAVASLRLLTAVDPQDQESGKALQVLPSSDRLVSDLPTELLLLRSELTSGETADAAELEKHILSTNPDSADLRIALSKTMEQCSDRDDALREATRAVELDPNSREAQIALGMASWEINGFQYNEQTLRAFTAAQHLDPDGYASNLSLGLIESQYHQYEPAAIHLHAALAVNPSAPEPWYQLGMNAWDQDRPAEAGDGLRHYLSLEESSKRGKPGQVRLALLILDRIADEQGTAVDPANTAAEDALKRQIAPQADFGERSSDAGAGLAAAGAPGNPSQLPGMVTVKKAGVRATPRQLREVVANSLNDMGTALARKHDYAAAVLPFHYAAEDDPALDPVMRNLGFAAFLSGSYEESEKALRQEIAIHSDDATARAYLGMALFETGEYSEASATFQFFGPALSSKPLVEATAAAAFARAGQRAQAEDTLADLSTIAPDPQVQAREAVAWLDLGDVGRATELAQAALSGNAQTSDALRVLGEIALERGDGTAAAREFDDELKVSSLGADDLLEARVLLAEALIMSANRSQGDLMARDLARTHPDLAKTLRSQGETLLKNGDAHAAYGKLGAAFLLVPGDEGLRKDLASAKRLIQPASK